MISTHHKQQGMALVFVVFVVALVAILATNLLSDQFIQIRQLDNHLKLARQMQHTYSVEAWGIEVLKRDQQTAAEIDHLQEDWASPLEATPLEDSNVQIRGWITDLNSRYNVNSLMQQGKTNVESLNQAKQVASIIDIEPALLEALSDWIDADILAQGAGAEDPHYTGLEPAYHTPNQPLSHISEAAYIKDMNGPALMTLEKVADALPQNTAINLNTASAETLAMTLAGLSIEEAATLNQQRDQQPWQSVDDFIDQLKNNTGMEEKQVQQLDKSQLAVNSQFFMITSEVLTDDQIFQMQSRVYRDPAGGLRIYERKLQYLQ